MRWQAHWLLSRCYHVQGKAAQELRVLQELTKLSDELDLPDLRARSRVRLARGQRVSGELAPARATASEALALAEEYGLPRHDIVEALMTLIAIDAESGQLAEARARAYRLLDTLCPEIPARLLVKALWTAATVRVRQGDRTAAVELLQRALGQLPSNEDPMLWMRLRLAAASLYLQMDPRDTAQARLRLEEAMPAAELIGMPLHQQEVLILQCQLAFQEGRFDDARAFSDRLLDRTEEVGLREQVRIDILRNQLAIIDGDRTTAVLNMERIAKQAQESSNVELSAEVWRALAEALTTAGGVGAA
ncbi:transcriptional regulator [Streptomyces cinnamoneus]|uniref:transcriptional regulator n=1 Tax=Streptomyces cinnamoneus TaxID=53446 RepID=UPI0033CD7ABA